jgi:CII-binding regulator of phage lambda lysogenization HflD
MATYKDILVLVDKVSAPLQKIQNSMKKTTEQTNKLTEKLKRFNDKMKDLTPTSNKVLSLTGKLTKSFIGLVGASGVITAGINKVAQYGDRIDKLSQKIGMSSKAFQEWDYIMSINGGEVETLQMGFKTLVTQIEGVQKGSKDSIKAFSDLGVKVKENNGQFRKADDVFNDVIRKLQQIKDPTQKMILANRLFGRSAAELRPLLNQEAEAIDELRDKANKMGLIMSDDDIKNAVQFTDTMNTLGRFFQANMNKALVQVLPKLTEIMNKIIELKEPLMAIIKFVGNIAVITLKVFGFLAKHWEILVGIGAALAVIAGPAIIAGIGALVAGLATVSWPLIGIGAAIGAVIAGLIALVRNWKTVWNTIKSVTSSVVNGILGFINKLLEKLGFLAYLIPGLAQIKIGKDIAGFVGDKISQNSVKQSQTNNTNNTTNNTTNFFGNIVASSRDTLDKLIHRSQTVPAN